jgi:hypothetical protein
MTTDIQLSSSYREYLSRAIFALENDPDLSDCDRDSTKKRFIDGITYEKYKKACQLSWD